jgi:hypothetical protein
MAVGEAVASSVLGELQSAKPGASYTGAALWCTPPCGCLTG